jgi:RNA polymerase sigma factor (sigma-70 family)
MIDPVEYLDFADAYARRYLRRHRDLDDLVGFARVGLMEAARRYDPRRGDFKAYAVAWMRREILMGIMLDRTIHVPYVEQWAARNDGSGPAAAALALRRRTARDGNDLTGTLAAPAPDDDDDEALAPLLAPLSPAEADALTLHLGLDGGHGRSFREVAEAMGTYKNMAGALIARARKKLRKSLSPPTGELIGNP